MDEDMFFALIGLAAIGVFFAPFTLSLLAVGRTGDFKRRIAVLEAGLSALGEAAPAAVMEAAVEPVPADRAVEEPPAPEPTSGPVPQTVLTVSSHAHALEE